MTVAAIAPAAVGNAHSQPSTPGNGSRKLSRPANWGRGLANALHAAVRCAELFAKRADNSSDGQPEEYGSALRSAGPRRGEARFGVEECRAAPRSMVSRGGARCRKRRTVRRWRGAPDRNCGRWREPFTAAVSETDLRSVWWRFAASDRSFRSEAAAAGRRRREYWTEYRRSVLHGPVAFSPFFTPFFRGERRCDNGQNVLFSV